MLGQVSVAQDIVANTVTDIALAPFDRFGAAGGKASLYATSETVLALVATLMFGSTAAMVRGSIPVNTTAGVVQIPRDLMAYGFGAPLDPITLTVENITGTAAFLQAKLVIE